MGVITRVQLLGGHRPLKIWEGKKRPKFSTFYNNFRLWLQISLDWIEISKRGKRRYQVRLIPCWTKKIGELWPINLRDYMANVYPPWVLESKVRVLRILMHLSAGHVTSLPGEFHLPHIFPQLDFGRWADSCWASPQISRLFIFLLQFFCSTRDLRDASADQREILHHDQH